jgi:glycosyltransferase involved in cell wall biosynthesis
MRIAALLPHLEVFGGVRRYLELGNELVRKGHSYVLFHPGGEKPSWLEFRGEVRPLEGIAAEEYDLGLCSEYSLLPWFENLRSRLKYFYFVLEGHRLEREVARRPYLFLGNSEGICRRIERKYGRACFRAVGGVNLETFHPLPRENDPGEPGLRILCYGRVYKKRKGIRRVLKAADGLARSFPGLKLVLFDTLVGRDRLDPRPLVRTRLPCEFHVNLPQSRMAWLYSRADLFVSAERRAGWSNTAAEAMACGLPVICTASGTRDFALPGETALVVAARPWFLRRAMARLIRDAALRSRLAEAGRRKISEFTWAALADRLEARFLGDLGAGRSGAPDASPSPRSDW